MKMIHVMKEKIVQAVLSLAVGLGNLFIIFFFKVLRVKEGREQERLDR